MKNKIFIRFLSLFLSVAFLATSLSGVVSALANKTENTETTEQAVNSYENSYLEYISNYKTANMNVENFVANPQTNFYNGLLLSTAETDGIQGVKIDEGNKKSFAFTVPKTGMYTIKVKYLTLQGKGSSLQSKIAIDGEIPFFEAGQITLFRIWTDETLAGSEKDALGNDLIPSQVEKYQWQEGFIEDHNGNQTEPYLFYLEEGEHTLTYTSIKEPVIINEFIFGSQVELPNYADVLADYEKQGFKKVTDAVVTIKAENPTQKSESTLYARNDRSSPATEPQSSSAILLNVIGGESWASSGQWIEWEFTVPKTGLYKLAFRAKQNLLSGASSSRKIYINGKVPFKEFNNLAFKYDNGWQMITPEYYVALESDKKHTIRMEVTTGELSEAIKIVDNSVSELNYAYRQIIMVTGTEPDVYRDYMLDDLLPEVFEIFEQQIIALEQCDEKLMELSEKSGSVNATLKTMCRQLKKFIKKPELIQKQLSNFQGNIRALSSWLITVRGQSLQIDSIFIYGENSKLPKVNSGFFKKIGYEASLFLYSFLIDYSYIGGDIGTAESIEVWIDSGRDQATILQELSSRFTEEYKIGVEAKLVNGQLLSATMAGRGPDAALNLGKTSPIDFAVRSAVEDLTQFKSSDISFDEVIQRFRSSAIEPFKMNDAVYALPETQTFPIMYYRTDIFEELSLNPPETWEEMYYVLSVLQKKNMTIGIPAPSSTVGAVDGVSSYLALLLQHGEELYTDDRKSTNLDSDAALEAFREWCSLYIDYSLPLKYDASNRFRTGEMPLIIADFTLYNSLSITAPEIRGLWSIAPIPGTKTEGGTVRHDTPAAGNACVIMSHSQKKEEAWKFLEWWTRAETQVDFGSEMENRLGESARYPSANIEAFSSMSWPIADFNIIQSQWDYVHGIPEVPGGYFISRHLNNAFRRVLYYNEDSNESLIRYNKYINEEIISKRNELELD